MLANYNIDKNNVIYQINVKKIEYNESYVQARYSSYPTTPWMSYLRLGYLLGQLNFVPTKLLDVGYGNGDFLKTASSIIPYCYGCDIEPAYPLPDYIHYKRSLFDEDYDVVCFFDSLEHFDNIYEIKKLSTKYIYISVPWCHYLNDEWFKNWKHRRENEHLWHFNLESLISFMIDIGFEYITHSNLEDIIRKSDSNLPNILTGLFKRL